MNYSSLLFREDTTGLDQYVKWCGKTSELMKVYLNAPRQVINGVSMVEFQGQLIPEEKIFSCFNKFFGIYDSYLERGYDIRRICESNGLYSLGAFSDDYKNCQYNCSDFTRIGCNQPKSKFSMGNGTTVIEMYNTSSIVRDLKTDATYYYSNKDVDFLRRFKEFHLDLETVAILNYGQVKKSEKYEILDGLESNRLVSNISKVANYQYQMNKFFLGYASRPANGKERYTFVPRCWYRGHCYIGRQCDNEPEAICEAYKLELSTVGSDREYLFNPINYHRNQRYLVERFVRDEISELGLMRDTLSEVACNPFLILRFGLVELCRKFCIYVPPFKLDEQGFMINLKGNRYSDLAVKYIDGVLTREQIATQVLL